MNYSKQRDYVLEAVQSSSSHPTAEMVYEMVQKKLPNISLGTVYRNLNQLVSLNKMRKIVMPDESDRFDKTVNPHYHLSCTKCRQVYDIWEVKMSRLNQTVSKKTGHQIESHDIVFVGICKECL